ncbi:MULTISPECIES: hypothetical protein [unclassified Variovorax]|jgi:hypothetical protein|uniref:hypothetical protein n=1 Tax=unclassified Variovorax TaxID=663243 RepID=UPI002B234667|nr:MULTISPECIES: hypothetical protein [unclassified Variovorax]MEB0059476.1 hypothetical protein [Variovorax sp. LG9.2]MEB0113229.1 hypothetical protein [Variovorax sp. RTB1]
MAYNLLQRLCTAQLPEEIVLQADIDKLQQLRRWGLVEADIPLAMAECGGHCYVGNAIVMRVTSKGRAAAKRNTRALPCGAVVRTARRQSAPSPFL